MKKQMVTVWEYWVDNVYHYSLLELKKVASNKCFWAHPLRASKEYLNWRLGIPVSRLRVIRAKKGAGR